MAIPMGRNVARGDRILEDLHRAHYRSLVRLASLLVGDVQTAEEVVQDAFVKLHLRWGGLRDVDRAPAYLRSAVLNGARSQLRRRGVRRRHAERHTIARDAAPAETGALARADHDRVVDALRALPRRQREAIALRYYLDLSEAEMVSAMGVSAGSVKTHLHRGLAALAERLEEDQ